MTTLTTFAMPLQRLILCGGGGLPPAYGPLQHADPTDWSRVNAGTWAWSPEDGRALRPDRAGRRVLDDPDRWALPMGDGAPWTARLALIAAWMAALHSGAGYADVDCSDSTVIGLHWCVPDVFLRSVIWRRHGALMRATSNAGPVNLSRFPALPTLPVHLTQHPPAVALPLALYDVPEIAFRVAAAASRISNPR